MIKKSLLTLSLLALNSYGQIDIGSAGAYIRCALNVSGQIEYVDLDVNRNFDLFKNELEGDYTLVDKVSRTMNYGTSKSVQIDRNGYLTTKIELKTSNIQIQRVPLLSSEVVYNIKGDFNGESNVNANLQLYSESIRDFEKSDAGYELYNGGFEAPDELIKGEVKHDDGISYKINCELLRWN